MAKTKQPDEPDDKRPRRKRDGRDRPVIVEIVKKRLEGGAPPTPDAYARALEEWQRLPGSVVRDPATITDAYGEAVTRDKQTTGGDKPAPNPKLDDKPRE